MPFADYAIGLVFFAVTIGAAGLAAWLTLERRLPQLAGAPSVAGFGVLTTAAVVVIHLLPGLLGLLSRWSALACAVLLAAAAWRVPPAPEPADARDVGLPVPRSPRSSWGLATLATAGLLAFVAAETWVGLAEPSTGVDTLTFHLPNVAEWIQSGTFWRVDTYTPLLASGNYPQNGDVVVLSAVLPWANDAFASLVNVPFVALAAVGVYAVAVELGTGRATAALLAATFTSLPVLSLAAYGGSQTDPALVAALIAAVLFLLRHRRTGRTPELVVAGVALGLAFGTKWYGLSSVAAVLLVWAAASLLGRHRPAAVAREAGVLIGLIALFGGFWLVRNWVVSGNPLNPLDVKVLGLTLFEAPRDFIRECAGFTIADYLGDLGAWGQHILPAYEGNYGLPGAVILAGLLVAAALSLAGTLGRGPRRADALRALALSVLALLLCVAYALTPYTAFGPEGEPFLAGASTRYLLPALVVAAPIAAWAVSHAARLRLPLEALAAVAVADGIRRGFEVPVALALKAVAGIGAVAALGVVSIVIARRLPRGGRLALGTAAVSLAAVAVIAVLHLRQQDFNDDRYMGVEPALDWIQSHAPEGERIALAGAWDVRGLSPVLPAFGPRFGNEVAYLGTYLDGQLREFETRDEWAAAARRRDFDLLLVGTGAYTEACPVPGSETDDHAWARREGFPRLAGSDRLTLYRVTPERPQAEQQNGPAQVDPAS